jgi:hypothetical protein
VNVKRSKLQRKYVNAMRGMAEVPWPARRFKYPPTLAAVPTGHYCEAPVTLEWERRGRLLGYLRAPKPKHGICGTMLLLVPFKRHVVCPMCAHRAKVGRRLDRIESPPATAEVFARWHGRRAKQAVGRFFSRRKV